MLPVKIGKRKAMSYSAVTWAVLDGRGVSFCAGRLFMAGAGLPQGWATFRMLTGVLVENRVVHSRLCSLITHVHAGRG